MAFAVGACAPPDEADQGQEPDQTIQNVGDGNGWDGNGWDANGWDANGWDANGLDTNGLGVTDLNTTNFSNWFNRSGGAYRTNSEMLMRYVAKCAGLRNTSRSWTNPQTGVTYTWPGVLGVAPNFWGGAALSTAEERALFACLGAHFNRLGLVVQVSFRGFNIAYDANEYSYFGAKEAYFVGDRDHMVMLRPYPEFQRFQNGQSLRGCNFSDTNCRNNIYLITDGTCTRSGDSGGGVGLSTGTASCTFPDPKTGATRTLPAMLTYEHVSIAGSQ